MNLISIINSLRKLLAFLVGLFPPLLVIGEAIQKCTSEILEQPLVKPHWEKFLELKQVQAIKQLINRFYFRSYARDQLDLEQMPQESVAILRPVFLMSASLCILLPVALASPGSLIYHIKLNSGADAAVPGWSICLWIAAVALGWGCTLAGAAVSNRVAFLGAISMYIWWFGSCALYLPRSYWNALLPAGAIIATWISECALKKPSAKSLIASIATAVIAGYSTGIYLGALTPLHKFLVPHQAILGPLIGMVLCLVAAALARLLSRNKVTPISTDAYVLSGVATAFLISLVARGGFGQLAEQLLSLLVVWNSYLWPIWYFIGAGIIFKLLKNSKTIAHSVRDLVHPRLFAPLVVTGVVGGCIICWSEDLANLSVIVLPRSVSELVVLGYMKGFLWFWHNPLAAIVAHWMRWVFLYDLIAVSWLIAKKRLSDETAGTLLFFTLLSWFLITEYIFELTSFTRSAAHSLFVLTGFAIGILWMFHSILLSVSLKSSPLWPSRGRLPLYGAMMAFCLLEIHARTAAQDFGVMNSIFLVLFRGIVDVGLPYSLYVLATRRFDELPLRLKHIFTLFCLGALFTFPLNIFDKLALCSGSMTQLQSMIDQQTHLLIDKGTIGFGSVYLPAIWIFFRALLAAVAIAAVGIATRIKFADCKKAPAAVLFAMMAFASGLASFSKTSIDLPFRGNMLVLLWPVYNSFFIDAFLVSTYLGAWLGALVLGLTLSWQGKSSPWRWLLATACAFSVIWLIQFTYPNHEAWLRATGLYVTGGLALELLLIYLVLIGIRRVHRVGETQTEASNNDAQEQSAAAEGSVPPAAPLVPNKQLHIIVAILLAGFAIAACIQLYTTRLVAVNVSCFKRAAIIPVDLGPPIEKNGVTLFSTTEPSGVKTTLILNALPANPGGAEALLKQLLQSTLQNNLLPNLKVSKAENWDHYCPGARSVFYSYDLVGKNVTLPMLGLTVVVQRSDKLAELYVLSSPPSDFEKRQWELARIISHISGNNE